MIKDWQFAQGNVQALWDKLEPDDQKLFAFDVGNVNWPQMIAQSVISGRTLLAKEDESTIPDALKRQTK